MPIVASRPRVGSSLGLFVLLVLTGYSGLAGAGAIDIQGGPFVFAISGLELDLPMAAEGCSYRVSSSYALSAEGYDGRDTIDDVVNGVLVGGTWISVGYFDAGGPAAVAASVALSDDWTAQYDAWGTTWSFHGGIFTFDGELGAQPTVVACATVGTGKTLVIHRFFLSEPQTMTRTAMLEGFAQSTVAQAARRSYVAGRTGTVMPTRRPECRSRGAVLPVRDEVLDNTLLELRIPDDGFVWMVRSDPSERVDYLERMAPAFPEVSIEIAILDADDCAAAHSMVGEELELTACYPVADGILVVGIFQGPQEMDVAHLAPMLEALAVPTRDW